MTTNGENINEIVSTYLINYNQYCENNYDNKAKCTTSYNKVIKTIQKKVMNFKNNKELIVITLKL